MADHEHKNCQRCNTNFECKAGSILECECNQIKLSYEERIYIEGLYTDCLCTNCLLTLQQQYLMLRKKTFDF